MELQDELVFLGRAALAAAFTTIGIDQFPATAEKLLAGVVTGVGFLGAQGEKRHHNCGDRDRLQPQPADHRMISSAIAMARPAEGAHSTRIRIPGRSPSG